MQSTQFHIECSSDMQVVRSSHQASYPGGRQGMMIMQLVTISKLSDKPENVGNKSELDEACIISAQI